MKAFSEKIFSQLEMPTEELPVSDQKRVQLALGELGYAPVTVPPAQRRRDTSAGMGCEPETEPSIPLQSGVENSASPPL